MPTGRGREKCQGEKDRKGGRPLTNEPRPWVVAVVAVAGIRERFGSEKKAQSPRSSPAAALDSPRPAPPRRKSTTASGAGELWERRQQDPASPRPQHQPNLPSPPRRSRAHPGPARRVTAAAAPTCAAAAQSQTEAGARGGGAAGRRAELVGRLRLPGRGQAGHAAAAAAAGAPSSWRTRDPARSAARARLPGQLREAPHPRARPALAAPAAPLPLRSPGPRGVGTRSPQSRHSVARSFPWFSRGDRLPWMLRLMCGQEMAKSCNSRL